MEIHEANQFKNMQSRIENKVMEFINEQKGENREVANMVYEMVKDELGYYYDVYVKLSIGDK